MDWKEMNSNANAEPSIAGLFFNSERYLLVNRGKFTGADWQDPKLWERYQGYFSPYLQKKIDVLQKEKQQSQHKVSRCEL